MVQLDNVLSAGVTGSHEGTRLILVPSPGVSKPDRGKYIQRCWFRSTIRDTDPNENVLAIGLRVLDKHVEISVLVEHACIQQFEFRLVLSAATIFFDQSSIGILLLRILVEVLHVRMRRRAIDIEVVLFNVFTVIAFTSGETKQPLLENGIFSIPQGERKADQLMPVGNTGDAVFIPAVCSRPGVIMRQIVSCRAVSAVILADCSPCALAEIGAPTLPVHRAILRFL